MNSLVIDASLMAWLFDDDDEPRADRALGRLVEERALALGGKQCSAYG